MVNASKTRLAIVAPESLPVPPVRGGAVESVIYQSIKELRYHYDITVVSPAVPELSLVHEEDGIVFTHVSCKSNPWWNKIPLRLAKVPFITFPRSLYSSPYINGMVSKVVEINPQIIHIHNSPLYVLFLKDALPNAKIILHMHNRHLVRMNKSIAREVVNKSDIIAGVSKYIINDVLLHFPNVQHKCRILYNGVETDKFRPLGDQNTTKVKQDFAIPNENNILLYAGRLTRQKGIHTLLKALEGNLPENWHLVIVGASWFNTDKKNHYTTKITELASKLSKPVIFTGHIPHSEMPSLLSAANIVVLPSIDAEAFPLIAIEAAAAGTPILCNDVGGAAESVIDGVTGFINRRPNEEALKAKLNYVFSIGSEQLRMLGGKARCHIEQNFSWKKCILNYNQVYSELL